MSEITERIQEYHDEETDWPPLRNWLVDYSYVTPARYDDPQPGPLEERDWDHTYVDGSWDEVQQARAHGLLTDAQYYEVSREIDACSDAVGQWDMAKRPEETFGDALCDDALIELRWKQRRQLRMIPGDFVARVKTEYLDPREQERVIKRFDARLAEFYLRHDLLAPEEASLHDHLSDIERAVLVRAMKGLFREWGAGEYEVLGSVHESVNAAGDDALLDGLWSKSGTDNQLVQFVVMLLLADELAGDRPPTA